MEISNIDSAIKEGRFEEAREAIDKLLRLTQKDVLQQALLHAQLAKSYTSQWRFYDAVPNFENALKLLDSIALKNEDWQYHQINITLDYCYALHTTRSFLKFTQTVTSLKNIIQLHGNNDQKIQYFKIVFMDLLHQYRWHKLPDEAIIVCEAIVQVSRNQKNIFSETDGLNNLSFSYMLNWQPAKSRNYALQALELIESHSNDDAKSMAYCYITNSYRCEKNVTAVKKWHNILQAHIERNKNPVSKLFSDSMLAWLCYAQEDFEQSEQLCQQVFINMTQNRIPFLPVCSLLLLALKLRKKDLNACCQQAFLLLHPNMQQSVHAITSLLKAGLKAFYGNEKTEVEQHFKKAIEIADQKGYL